MGFQQGLSGLNVSAKSLEAIGNNIANSNTVGFKSAMAQFADVYAASLGGGGAGQVGIGSSVPKIAQLFTQGNVTTTSNPLDLAVNGDGLFRLSNNGVITYSRNGQFQVDKNGYIINPQGLHLTGYAADQTTGAIVPGNYVDLQVNTSNIPPNATATASVQVNLDSRSTTPSLMTSGSVTGVAPPGVSALTVTAASNALDLDIDGVAATVYIPIQTYNNVGDLVTAVQTAINTDPSYVARNISVAVNLNSTGSVVITSNSAGTLGSQGTDPSAVHITGGNGATALFGGTLAQIQANQVDGTDNFDPAKTLSYTASTAQTEYDSLGNPHNLTIYFVKTGSPEIWQVYTALDGVPYSTTTPVAATGGSLAGTVPTGATIDLSAAPNLDMVVDGVSYSVPLTTTSQDGTTTAGQGIFDAQAADATGDIAKLVIDLQADLDAYFGGLATPLTAPTVAYANGTLTFTSATTGGSSDVTFTTPTPAGGVDPTLLMGAANTWTHTPGTAATTKKDPIATTMQFSAAGVLQSTATIDQSFTLTNGATSPFAFTLDLTGTTQYGISFGVNQLTQDGYTSGRLSGMSVSSDGTVLGRYSNGKSRNMGQLVLAKFNNPNGLLSIGGNQWQETADSGQAIPGTPGQGSLGVVQAAAVEEANVDLTAELVNMITQQRVYQANAQTIKTQDQVLQTLVNLR